MDIYYKLDCMKMREFTSSESKNCMGNPYKGLTAYLALRNKSPNKKQNARFAITGITKQDFRKLLMKFEKSLYLDYNS